MIPFILNLPYTLLGFIPAILSGPASIKFNLKPLAIVFEVKSFWWKGWYLKNARAMTVGNIILLSPKILKNDFEHELIHIKQYQKYPLIYPALYYYEFFKKGYKQNKFEDEAYRLSKSIYKGK